MRDVYAVAELVRSTLVAAGYRVVMTKPTVDTPTSLGQRATIANQAHAALALSIHDQAGANGGLSFDSANNNVYYQSVGTYRETPAGKKVYFTDARVAAESKTCGAAFERARSKAQGEPVNLLGNTGYDLGTPWPRTREHLARPAAVARAVDLQRIRREQRGHGRSEPGRPASLCVGPGRRGRSLRPPLRHGRAALRRPPSATTNGPWLEKSRKIVSSQAALPTKCAIEPGGAGVGSKSGRSWPHSASNVSPTTPAVAWPLPCTTSASTRPFTRHRRSSRHGRAVLGVGGRRSRSR